MDKKLAAMCGAYCGDCEWKEKMGCAGCQVSKSDMFWGTCSVAACCAEKDYPHCGMCPDVPCEVLQAAFDHPEHGDKGERLANLKAWAVGEDTYIPLGTFGDAGGQRSEDGTAPGASC